MKSTPNLSMLPIVQQSYQNDPQTLLAQELLKAGGSQNTNTIGGGLASAIKSLSGAYFGKQAKDRYQQQSTEVGNELSKIATNPINSTPDALISAMAASPNQFVKDMSTTAYGQMMANMLTPRDPLKVAPGETLYDPRTHQPIFSAAAKPEAVGEGGTLVNPQTGQAIFSAPQKPMAVAPGGTVVNPGTGQQIYKDNLFGSSGGGNGQGMPGQDSTIPIGDDFVKTLPPALANQVKGIYNGDLPYPPIGSRSPQAQATIAAISQAYPDMDAHDFKTKSDTLKDFKSGSSSNSILAINKAMAHAQRLSNSMQSLNNTGVPIWNSVANSTKSALGNTKTQTAMTAAGTDISAYVNEVAKVFRNSGMSESDINDWRAKISTASSPAQAKSFIQESIGLMDGQLQGLTQKYNQGIKTNRQPLEMLSPEAAATWQKLSGQAPSPTADENIPTGGVVQPNAISPQDAIAELRRRGHQL